MAQHTSDQEKYSREVEEILRRKPGFLVRKGILLLALAVILLLAGSWFITYPEKLVAHVTFDTITGGDSIRFRAETILTSAAASLVKPGQPVTMLLQPSPGAPPVKVDGTIEALRPVGGGDYLSIRIRPANPVPLGGYGGTVTIITGETSILSKILNPVFAVFRTADR